MRFGYLILGLLVIGMIPAGNADMVVVEGKATATASVPVVMEGVEDSGELAKLAINPIHKHIQLKPGEEEEFKVKVKNKGDEDAVLTPALQVLPYGQYMLDEDWVAFSPAEATLGPDAEQEFTISVNIPEDADVGNYNAQVTFTGDSETQTVSPYPVRTNALNLDVYVWKPPTIIISNNFIHDRVEAGKTYEYRVTVENRGNTTVPMNPKFGADGRFGTCMGMYCPGELEEGWVTISAPESIEPGSKAAITISVSIPEDARGQYEGRISLNIEDPSMPEWQRYEQTVNLNLQVWQQPTSPYEKEFTVSEGTAKLSVEVSVSEYAYERYRTCGTVIEEPSFRAWLRDPDSNEVEPEPARTVVSGSVNLGSWSQPPWEEECGAGVYNLERVTYKNVYTVPDPAPGIWTLYIMPENAQRFEYSIEVE